MLIMLKGRLPLESMIFQWLASLQFSILVKRMYFQEPQEFSLLDTPIHHFQLWVPLHITVHQVQPSHPQVQPTNPHLPITAPLHLDTPLALTVQPLHGWIEALEDILQLLQLSIAAPPLQHSPLLHHDSLLPRQCMVNKVVFGVLPAQRFHLLRRDSVQQALHSHRLPLHPPLLLGGVQRLQLWLLQPLPREVPRRDTALPHRLSHQHLPWMGRRSHRHIRPILLPSHPPLLGFLLHHRDSAQRHRNTVILRDLMVSHQNPLLILRPLQICFRLQARCTLQMPMATEPTVLGPTVMPRGLLGGTTTVLQVGIVERNLIFLLSLKIVWFFSRKMLKKLMMI